MPNNKNQSSKTDARQVRQQNRKAAQNQPYDTEFAAETDVQQVRQQNQQSQQNKQ